MTMGLEPMHPMDWIEIDEHYEEEMALRRTLMKEKRDIVLVSLPGVGSIIADACLQNPAKGARIREQPGALYPLQNGQQVG